MTGLTVSAILTLLRELLLAIPSATVEIKKILEKDNPTSEDWIELKNRISISYEERVPHTKLPKE